jgi:hypothetical protein
MECESSGRGGNNPINKKNILGIPREETEER